MSILFTLTVGNSNLLSKTRPKVSENLSFKKRKINYVVICIANTNETRVAPGFKGINNNLWI